MVNEATLALGRSLQTFDLEMRVLTKTPVRQPGGKVVDSYEPGGDVIPARLSPIKSTEPVVLGRAMPKSSFYLVLPWDQDLPNSAAVRVTNPTAGWAKDLSVIGRHTPRSYQIMSKLIVEEL